MKSVPEAGERLLAKIGEGHTLGTGYPLLVVLYGPPCSGKTTVGTMLQTHFGLRRVTMDDARQALLSNEDKFTDSLSPTVFGVLLSCAHSMLSRGQSLVCEGAFADTNRRRQLIEAAAAHGTGVLIVRFTASREDLLERLKLRHSSSGEALEGIQSQVSPAKLLWFLSLYHPPLFAPLPNEYHVDTSAASVNDTFQIIASLIKSQRTPDRACEDSEY